MTARTARSLRSAASDDRGAALLTVVGISLVMLLLIAIGASYSLSGIRKADTDGDASAALAAAYAGADEFTSRLSNDARYSRFGNPASPFTIANGSTGGVTLPTGVDANPAFNVTAGAAWASIPVPPPSTSRAFFRYEVDNSQYDRTGVIRVRSTGKVDTTTRSVIVNIKQKGFINYLYFTDLESTDPVINSSCNTAYDYVTNHSTGCHVQFGSSDWLHGPIHSNDTFKICSAKFDGAITTGDQRATNWDNAGCSTAPTFGGGAPVSVAPMPMPPTNTALANEARADMPDTVPRPGCMYTGPTKITFLSAGSARIVSPLTKYTQPAATVGASLNPAGCGTPGTGPGQLGYPGGSTAADPPGAIVSTVGVPLDHNLIWVQTVPTNTADPNYRSMASGLPGTFQCLAAAAARSATSFPSRPATSAQPAGWAFGSAANLIRYPLATEITPTTESSVAPSYSCSNGDVYVEGTLKGAITVAAANYVYLTGNLRYTSADDDILGIIGQNAVWVWDPRTCTAVTRTDAPAGTFPGTSGCGKSTTSEDRRFDAAILSVAHTFMVQSFDSGSRGDLTVFGSIAQKFRGPVGNTSGAGYDKDYWYDERFRQIAPPKFLAPTSTTYGVTQYASTAPAFTSTGAPN
ncbi:hypothetical protein [Agromyces sp. PvR057]|uniref:hypothetical protein n=1 Tax=Agromyces sp. PvR057 TaxID=3156403 RepID=UPI00339B7CC9